MTTLSIPLIHRVLDHRVHWLAPVGAPEWALIGEEAPVFEEMELLLQAQLTKLDAEQAIQQLLLPDANARRIQLAWVWDRWKQPRVAGLNMSVLCELIPDPRGSWVIAPDIPHSFFISKNAVPEKAIKQELGRVLKAWDADHFDRCSLLPPERGALVTMDVKLSETSAGSALEQGRTGASATQARHRLSQVATALAGKPSTMHCHGHENCLQRLRDPLRAGQVPNCVVVGHAHASRRLLLR